MLFNSFTFLLFFPFVTVMFFVLPHRFRWLFLLLASCFFYMFFKPEYILILGATIVVDYFAGIFIAEAKTQRKKKLFLILSLFANISTLAFFKYYNFINYNITDLAGYFGYALEIPMLSILLPIGLSFHTFQAMSYTIEVYRGKQPPERHFGIYSLYVMFYPQLVAGPIERPQNLLHQFHAKKFAEPERITSGLKLMAWGLFKKLVVADRLAVLVDQVYNNPDDYSGISIIIATLFFAQQIYCDFSGYSDIAIGSARVMGFDLMKNFNNPYFSRSISEFWSRWHISLSTWFKDYLYIPLGGNRVSVPRWMLNLMITFLVSGLWHGASYTFIIWGGLNGFFIICEILVKKRFGNRKLIPGLSNIITLILICFTWLFFRANTLPDAWMLLGKMISLSGGAALDNMDVLFGFSLIFCLEAIQVFNSKYSVQKTINSMPYGWRLVVYAFFITFLLNFGIFNNSQFIYFQF